MTTTPGTTKTRRGARAVALALLVGASPWAVLPAGAQIEVAPAGAKIDVAPTGGKIDVAPTGAKRDVAPTGAKTENPPSPANATTQRIESGAHRVALVELFTSEGCSSCPPADRWMSGLADDPRLWKSLVPVAFHVDYWDYIGWPDRFASPEYSKRQRRHARRGNITSVYTPGFVVHGREWRGWFRRPVLDLGDPPPAGVIRIDVTGTRIDATYEAAPHATRGSDHPIELHLALLGADLRTRVEAGENDGRTLEHDFVVLSHRAVPMRGPAPAWRATTELPVATLGAPRRALAAWVSRPGDPAPLQAAGGWLR